MGRKKNNQDQVEEVAVVDNAEATELNVEAVKEFKDAVFNEPVELQIPNEEAVVEEFVDENEDYKELYEKIVDELVDGKLTDATQRELISFEIIKRRRAEQDLIKYEKAINEMVEKVKSLF